MIFQIDNASDRPVYQQIVDQVKREIALGRIKRDERLPTVRQLAADLVINPNTIAKAYRQLEQEGIITTRAGSGAFIAQLDSSLSREVCERIIRRQMEMLVVDAVHMQIPGATLGQWFEETLKQFHLGLVEGNSHE